DFGKLALAHPGEQLVEADVPGTDAIERREPAHEDEIEARVAEAVLDRGEIGGGRDDAEERRGAPRRAAEGAHPLLREVVAAAAAAHRPQGIRDRLRKGLRPRAVVLQQVVGHALGRARADAREDPQRLQEPLERGRRRYGVPVVQNGSLNPGGSPSPAVMPLIFSAMVASTRCAASLNAAATRSSSISRSSPSSEGSMETRFTSCLHVICTFTMPAPDCPSTSMEASCSCMRRMLSCIICACFMSCPRFGFISAFPSQFPAQFREWWTRRSCRRKD